MSGRLSIIIPTLNEAGHIQATLAGLAVLREQGHQIIVADGGSEDDTVPLAKSQVDRIVEAPPGRAAQMNAGARAAQGDVLLFLHADTRLPAGAERLVLDGIQAGALWGRFDVQLSGRHFMFRIIERMMNWRSCLTGVATGDQAIFVRGDVFRTVGGYPLLPLMEDIAISKLLRKKQRPLCLRRRLITSSRRWETHGIYRTILLMWRLRFLYAIGVDAHTLAKAYR